MTKSPEDLSYAEYSTLIGLIYHTAKEPVLWPELLQAMSRYATTIQSEHSLQAVSPDLDEHITRAVDIRQHIAQLELKNSTNNQILNQLPIGILVVNKNMEVVAMNERASIVLAEAQGLSCQHGLIQTRSRRQTRELQKLVQACVAGDGSQQGNAMLIRGQGISDTSLWITASDHQHDPLIKDPGVAMIYIASALIRPDFDVQSIQDAFELTAAEAKVVKALANGCHNLNNVADTLGISIHTVRTQIKKAFEKTGTSNQIELVKKVLTSPSAMFGSVQPPVSLPAAAENSTQWEPCPAIILASGHRLAYAEYGDPEGKPVLMFHAVFGSRLQYPANDGFARKAGLRMIVPDRPGHGYSDMLSHRRLLDWPEQVLQLADQLDLETFSLLGYSGGANYALACACKIPRRLEQVVLVSFCSADFLTAEQRGLSWDRLLLKLAVHSPDLFLKLMKVVAGALLNDPIKALERRYQQYCQSDQAIIAQDAANRERYALSLREALRQGTDGVAQDIITINQWGFSLQDITMPIRFWHGMEDRQFPLSTARQLADSLPDCKATFVPGVGAMLILHSWQAILSELADG